MRNETRNPLGRSFAILRYLIDAGAHPVGVRKIATDLKMAPSSIHRLLTALVEEGLVARDEALGLYSVGAEMVRLCHKATDQLPVSRIAMPVLRELVGIANETALLGLYDGVREQMMFVAAAESSQPLRYVNKMWEWMPVYAGASGLAIMAYLPASVQQEIIARTKLAPITDRTITERYKLEHQLKTIRERGYAVSRGQRTIGAVAIGAPIFSAGGEVMGDVVVTIPEQRFDPGSEATLADHVMECANRITVHLGGASPERTRTDVEALL
jgi:DNA-binding IclR family transcriptional regulator